MFTLDLLCKEIKPLLVRERYERIAEGLYEIVPCVEHKPELEDSE